MPSKKRPQNIRLISRFLDLIAIVICFALAGAIATLMQRHGFFIWPEPRANDIGGWPLHYAALLIASLSVWAAASGYVGVYKSGSEVLHPSFRRLLRAITLWLCLIVAVIFLLKLRSLSRQFTITFLSLASLAIALRYVCQAYALSRVSPAAERNAIVVGEAVSAMGLSQLLHRLRAYDSVALAGQPLDAPSGALAGTCRNNQLEELAHQPAEVFLLSGSGVSITQTAILDLLKERRVVHIVPALIDAALFLIQ